MKKLIFHPLLVLLLIWGLSACEETLIGPATPNNPEQNFETLWQEYDRLFGMFEVKQVDWNALYAQYRPQVKSTTSDTELFAILSGMLSHLNDSHITLKAPGPHPMDYSGGIAGSLKREDFSLAVVKQKYLLDAKTYGENIVYGKVANNLGYIHFSGFDYDVAYYKKAMDDILGELKNMDGLVIDIREHLGGDDRISQYVGGCFANSKKLFMVTKKRNGPKHSDFTEPVNWYIQPEGKYTFTKPVTLLTNRWTASAGETFALAMKQNAQVVQIGDTTQGIFSEGARRELPNGWYYSISVGDYRAADGESYEGIGLTPDILIQNTKAEVQNGQDRALEKAIEILH